MGFHPSVVTFFASYLVERFTRYAWNNFTSDPFQADVGVGQGSALSPVLSAIILAPLSKLFKFVKGLLSVTLVTYVDDGSCVVESKETATNVVILRMAYSVMVGYFIAAGLAMEHDKNELFHFSRARKGWDLGIELGFGPYVDGVLLKPKKYW